MASRASILRWRTALTISIHGAVSACGPFRPAGPTASALDVPEVRGAAYVAFAEPVDDESAWGGQRGPTIVLESGRHECASSMRAEAPRASCPPELHAVLLGLARGPRSIVVMDGSGRTEVLTGPPRAPIESAAQALVAVWLDGRYSPMFSGGPSYVYGSLGEGYVRPIEGGFEVLAGDTERSSNCGEPDAREIVRSYRVTLLVTPDGRIELRSRVLDHEHEVADPCHPLGRRPERFVDVASGGTLSGHLRRAMHHEAESVRAFQRFATELEAHGAPGALVGAARRAARDERRHAWMFARLLGTSPRIDADELPVRPLAECARDNTVEGCVRETYSAAVAAYQAERARTPSLRGCFARIARDEIAHAALARAAREWLDARLSSRERARQRRAAREAEEELARSFRDPMSSAELVLGFPPRAHAEALLDSSARAGRPTAGSR